MAGRILSTTTAVVLLGGVSAGALAQMPALFLNEAEISGIRAKVKAGSSPWKAASDKSRSIVASKMSQSFALPEGYDHKWLAGSAQRSVEDKYDYPYDNHRRTASEFGVVLVSAAMSWHITGESKYADWLKRNIDSWFFDPDTYMEAKGATVGLNASMMGVAFGVSLAWPALTDTQRGKLRDWWGKLHATTNLEFGGVGGNHNRADWAVAMKMASGLLAGTSDVVNLGRDHLSQRKVSDDGDISVGGAGEESRANYTYFAIQALTCIAEMCRHQGVDSYALNLIGGRGIMERLFDRYGRYYNNPGLWQKETGNDPAKDGYFVGTNFYVWEIAYAFKEKSEYYDVIRKVGRPMTDWSSAGGYGNPFGNPTLTHARGAYPFQAGAAVPPPSVEIDSPADKSVFAPGDTVTIRVSASHQDGTVAEVRFYTGETLLGKDTDAPYEWRWANIPEGQHTIKVAAVDAEGETATTSVSISAVAPLSLPGKIEAEAYSAMDGIQTESTSDAGGGKNVGWIDEGDWTEFGVTVESSGVYAFAYRVASTASTGQLELLVDGAAAHQVAVPNTGGWQSWTSVTATAPLEAGSHTLRIVARGADWNINYIEVTGPGATATVAEARDIAHGGVRLTRRDGSMVGFRGAAAGEVVCLWSVDGRLVARARANRHGLGNLPTRAPGMFVLKAQEGEPMVIMGTERRTAVPDNR